MLEFFTRGAAYLGRAAIVGTIAFLLIWGLFWRKEKLTIGWNMIRWLFCIYFTAILLITRVISSYGWHFAFGVFNMRPFSDGFSGQVLMNLLLFLPFGVLVPFVFRKTVWNYGRVLFLGFAVSAAIELIQFFFVGRYADITDVMMNTAGTAAGALVYRWISIRFSAEELKKKEKAGACASFFCMEFIILLLAVPYKALRLCMGDVMLASVFGSSMTWSGNLGGALDYSGIHITLILLIFALLFWAKLCENTWKKYMKRSIFLPAGVGVGILGCMLALQALL